MSDDLLLKAVKHHTDCKWALLYIERWLKAPMQDSNGKIVERLKGTPQGGCVSPILSNLFLHYVFDKWMTRNHPSIPWCRYADDGLLHCKSEQQAKFLLQELKQRFAECGLEIHPVKTRIVYCKDVSRKANNDAPKEFKFLGFVFKQRVARNPKLKTQFMSFQPSIGDETLKQMRKIIKYQWKIGLAVHMSLADIAKEINPKLRDWINYYGMFYRSRLKALGYYIDRQIMKWFRNKYKTQRGNIKSSKDWLKSVFDKNTKLFAHWSFFAVY